MENENASGNGSAHLNWHHAFLQAIKVACAGRSRASLIRLSRYGGLRQGIMIIGDYDYKGLLLRKNRLK